MIWCVTVAKDMVVVAETEDEAMRIAEREARGDDGELLTESVRQVRSLRELPEGWEDDCLPYGTEGNRATLRSLLPAK